MPADPLTDEQREIRDLVRTLSRERIAPRAAEIDKTAEFPWDVVELFRENDLFGILYDEQYGGIGESSLMTFVVIEELSKVCATSGLIIAAQELGSLGIKLAGTAEQKQRWLPKLASGERLAAYALTEPGSGSDSAAMLSTARREGDEWILNGGKRFITNAGVASVYVVFAKTDPQLGHAGISAFVVEADAPGFEVGRIEPKMGIKGSTTGEIFFNDCRIPADNLLGNEGEGDRLFLATLDGGRIGIGAMALGLAQAAYEAASAYAKERKQFGKPIASFQGVAFMIADMATEIDAARLMVYRAAWLKDQHKPFSTEAAMAKLYASEVAQRVTNDAIQVHGGYGYISEYRVERYLRDAKLTEIGEGTSQIQRMVIARNLLGVRSG